MYRLHGFCQSGNTFKVAFCLLALGQKFETVFVDFMSGATRDAAWRERTNEMGEAPVLEDGAKWDQVGRDPVRRAPKAGSKISIRRASMGSSSPSSGHQPSIWALSARCVAQ